MVRAFEGFGGFGDFGIGEIFWGMAEGLLWLGWEF